MTAPEPAARFDLLIIRDFFDARTCEKIIAEMRTSPAGPATVYRSDASGSVDERTRKATRSVPSRETTEFVVQTLLERKRSVEEHFRLSISECEDPQFLRYGAGDFFVAHQDGNTGLLRLDKETARKVSVVIFLSRQTEFPESGAYCGGHLVFHDWGAGQQGECFQLCGEPGTLVAFRPETTHEVTTVTHGERYSIACWYM